MNLVDFNNCEYSDRNLTYGGNAGSKEGVYYNGERWIVKYPKSTKGFRGADLPRYTTSPLSEYIGSNIYNILGYDVHETLLGIKKNYLVVACKDFRSDDETLLEVRLIKNGFIREQNLVKDENLPISATGDNVNLNEILYHFKENPFFDKSLKKKEFVNRFWECAIIDAFIVNNDRNNGNWGFLRNNKTGDIKQAPVYDNGNCLYNKHSAIKFAKNLSKDDQFLYHNLLNSRTVYAYNDHSLNVKKLISLDIPEVVAAMVNIVPLIDSKIGDIMAFIDNIPLQQMGYDIIQPAQKEYYKKVLTVLDKQILLPKYEELVKNKNLNLSKNDIHYKRYSHITKHKSAIDRAKSASKCAPTKNYNINKDYR